VAFPFRSFGLLQGDLQRSVVVFDRVRAVLADSVGTSYGEARLRGHVTGSAGATLEVDRVRYAHVPGTDVLRDITFTVAPGRTLAVVGATASGKSTLATLLFRLVDPDDGAIRVDGVDLRDLAPGALAEVAALVPQTAFLFDDTVRDNVTLGGPWSDEEVWAALRVAQAHEFVRALPGGLDARLGERGTTLSGGQRQRLSLARALVRQPRLLVMDDATSAVDPEVEARILTALRESAGGATVVVVAYRKATIGLADEVVFLRDGVVADHGTHADLLRRNPAYADLVNAYETDQHAVEDEGGAADLADEPAGAVR
jgi:ABC-type multidrug transport system fused ATPase/permease subunit